MRIESIPPKELLSRYIRVRERAEEPINTSATDEAQLTDEAKTFSAAMKAAKECFEASSPEREARIQEVARQIEEGTYSVPGQKVAEKILGM
jgi:anti-sigma28 factor (negative regulator of flagellin synthesis)